MEFRKRLMDFLSLHRGLRRALAALFMGTALFSVVQFVVAVNLARTTGRARRRFIYRMASLRPASG